MIPLEKLMGEVGSISGRLLVSGHIEHGRKELTCCSSDCVETCQVRVEIKSDIVYRPEHEYPEKEVDEALLIS